MRVVSAETACVSAPGGGPGGAYPGRAADPRALCIPAAFALQWSRARGSDHDGLRRGILRAVHARAEPGGGSDVLFDRQFLAVACKALLEGVRS
jgi:hypothetical protein